MYIKINLFVFIMSSFSSSFSSFYFSYVSSFWSSCCFLSSLFLTFEVFHSWISTPERNSDFCIISDFLREKTTQLNKKLKNKIQEIFRERSHGKKGSTEAGALKKLSLAGLAKPAKV